MDFELTLYTDDLSLATLESIAKDLEPVRTFQAYRYTYQALTAAIKKKRENT